MKRFPLFSSEQARRIDRRVGETIGLSGFELMARAGSAALEQLRRTWPRATDVCVVCGSGNNGGDGLVLARLAKAAGLQVQLFLAGHGPREGSEAKEALAQWKSAGGEILPLPAELPKADVYVDAVLGIGLNRAPEGEVQKAVEALYRVGPVFSLDVPSGVDADTGHCPGLAVNATQTVSFIVRKFGLYTGEARNHTGDVILETLDLPDFLVNEVSPLAWLQRDPLELPPRRQNTHKGDYGRVLVIGGAPGYTGAVRMAAEASLRVGAGLVTIATHPDHAGMLNIGRWELMVRGVQKGNQLREMIEAASVVAIGPGLSCSPWGREMWQSVLGISRPLVVDADALNLLAQAPHRSEDWILTPHPGEAARMLGWTGAKVQSSRREAVSLLRERFGGTVILKGSGTLVHGKEELTVCDAGNPGMASGGMGDVLTGVLAGLMAQGLTPFEAAKEAVCLHAVSGDLAAREGQRGMLATDLLPWLRRLVNGLHP